MTDIADHLHERARLIGHAFNHLGNVWFKGGKDYDWHEELRVAHFGDGGQTVHYARKHDKERQIHFTVIRDAGLSNRKVQEIPIGTPKPLDMMVAKGFNYDGVVAVPLTYEGEFGKVTTAEEAFMHGLTQSLETSFKFTQGGEAASFKAEQEIKLGFESRQDWSRSEGEEENERRLAGIAPVCPPGYDIEFQLIRTTQKMKLKVTGIGKVDHAVQLGKKQRSWKGNKGKGGRLWPRWAKYDSFYEECLPVLKGEGRRDLMFAEEFRRKPAPKWLIDRLERPLDIPFEHTSLPFDSATNVEQHQEVLRGPKT